MKHRGAILLAAGIALLAGLWWSIWHLVTGPLAHLVHSRAQTGFAVLTITLVCVSLVTGIVVGEWDALKEEPRKHRRIMFRPLLHH